MTRLAPLLALLGAALLGASCNTAADPIDRVQTNLVDKAVFEGEWWYAQTIVDLDGDASGIVGMFKGDMGWTDWGVDKGQSGSIARIRWVIDENYLFAYRAYELIDGGNDDGRDPEFRGQPLAVFAIDEHVDVRQDYSASTGEPTNVRVENSSDRRWYERQYMRVDWSQNLTTAFYGVDYADLFNAGYRRESAPFFVQGGSHEEFPDSWHPQFIRIGDDGTYRYRDEWPSGTEDTVHYMSFVTRELYSPGANCIFYGGACQTVHVTKRNAFLRVPPEHQYAVATQSHDEFDKFGLFRTYQRTYIRGGRDKDQARTHCTADADCGEGGACDTTEHVCIGGLSSDYGETDFLTFYSPRHNVWRASLTDRECGADWECDGRYDDTPGVVGSVCDRAARRCTIPVADRETREVAYHLSPGYPAHLVPAAFQVVGDWNEAFMRGQRAAKGLPLPAGDPIDCQDADPTAYCYCGSPEDSGGTCPWRYDPFESPAAAEAAGVTNPYNCYVARPEGYTEPEHPESYDEYEAPLVFQHEFMHDHEMGESECVLVLRSNSCDADPEAPCEELGDIRYQFFNYISHGNLYFGGVSLPLVDPTTGEFVTANANMAGESIESVGTRALVYFPVLRGEPGAEERYFTGEDARGYFERLGHTEHPVSLASDGSDGYSGGDRSRPGIPTDLLGYYKQRIDAIAPQVRPLRGAEGRAQILGDRMQRLAGTEVEARLVAALGENGRESIPRHFDVARLAGEPDLTDPAVLDRVSPLRTGFASSLFRAQERLDRLGAHNVCPGFDEGQLFKNSDWEYFANAFEDRSGAEASIRMQQAFLRGVMWHEMGHSVGLRHNFAGNFDRDNYPDGYFRIARDLPLPELDDFDADSNGYVSGAEINAYVAELRRVRTERAARGAGNVMASSIMDYHGDLSDLSGIGRYDVAAAIWSHYGMVEQFDGDPITVSTNSLNGLHNSDQVSRSWVRYYEGGESCRDDSECPFTQAEAVAAGSPIWQRCITNTRLSPIATPCTGAATCMCSSMDLDWSDYLAEATDLDEDDPVIPYEPDADGDGALDHHPVRYLFCTDDRTSDISWCSRFDAGESFQEALEHYRQSWEESYPSLYYRRFRRYGAQGFASGQSIRDAAKIFQHFFFRYFYEPDFETDTGPLGVVDQIRASADAMDWFIELANLPEVGSYELDPATNTYDRVSPLPGAPGADASLAVGEGFPMWSTYQDGYWGFFRVEQAGTFYDKFYALYALAVRDWGLSYSLDERYYINFFSLFPVEMTEFFGGIILDEPRWYAPRLELSESTPQIQHMSWDRQNCRRDDGEWIPCRGSQESEYPASALGGTMSEVLRDWATILALAQFPVYYDTTFEQRLSVFKLDNGDGFALPDTQPDGAPTCAYGDEAIDPAHDTGCAAEDSDYVLFNSTRFHTPYVAVKVRSRLAYNLEEEQLGFQLLRRLVDMQTRIAALDALADPTDEELAERATLAGRLAGGESFLEYLIDIQRRYGISSYF